MVLSSKWTSAFTAFVALILLPFFSHASESYLLAQNEKISPYQGYLLAQATDDDSFDPFSDYSEFDEDTDEEADINFFRNGRFLTVGFVLGFKGFTGDLATDYTSGGAYGVFLAYFFDLRFALQLGYTTGDYAFQFKTSGGAVANGDVAFNLLSINTKYYFNTQNVTKGLADLNPYLILGLSDVFRTYTLTSSVTGSITNAVESAWGFDAGLGIEIPMMRKKAYFGFQGTFHYINFPDSNSAVYLSDYSANSTLTQAGFQYDLLGLIGINF